MSPPGDCGAWAHLENPCSSRMKRLLPAFTISEVRRTPRSFPEVLQLPWKSRMLLDTWVQGLLCSTSPQTLPEHYPQHQSLPGQNILLASLAWLLRPSGTWPHLTSVSPKISFVSGKTAVLPHRRYSRFPVPEACILFYLYFFFLEEFPHVTTPSPPPPHPHRHSLSFQISLKCHFLLP